MVNRYTSAFHKHSWFLAIQFLFALFSFLSYQYTLLCYLLLLANYKETKYANYIHHWLFTLKCALKWRYFGLLPHMRNVGALKGALVKRTHLFITVFNLSARIASAYIFRRGRCLVVFITIESVCFIQQLVKKGHNQFILQQQLLTLVRLFTIDSFLKIAIRNF